MAVYTVKIERAGGELGFSVKGGKEHGIGILVSDVDPRGVAHRSLEVGDEILYVNGHRLLDASHSEAVQVLRGAASGNELELTVQHHVSVQSALATPVADYEKMQSDFERMREKIRSRPLAPVQAMQGAPQAKSFPFPPFLTSRWTTSRTDDSVVQSPTERLADSLGGHGGHGGGRGQGLKASHTSAQVLPGMQQSAGVEETDGGHSGGGGGGGEPRTNAPGRPVVATTEAVEVRRGSLPEGWVQRLDPRTKQFFYENHWLGLSFWTDPRSTPPVADVTAYKWTDLPSGWHRFVDKNDFVYYINHHNHTSHWESPTLMRQVKLLAAVKTHYTELNECLQVEAQTLKQKRVVLLKNRDELQRLTAQRDAMDKQSAAASSPAASTPGRGSPDRDVRNSLNSLLSAIVEEVMQLNEAIEALSTQLGTYQKGLSSLEVLRRQAQEELNCGVDLSPNSATLAGQLHTVFVETTSLHRQKVLALYRLESQRKRQRKRSSMLSTPSRLNASLSAQRSVSYDGDDGGGESMSPDTSLLYMLQLPGGARTTSAAAGYDSDDSDSDSDVADDDAVVVLPMDDREQRAARRVHALRDELTVKCNLEMRVDVALLQRLSARSRLSLDMLRSWEGAVRSDRNAWTTVVDKLSGMDDLMEAFHCDWVQLPFKEKLRKLTSS